MKMDRQTRTFAKQVQVDLLGLADTDLFQTIHLWMSEGPSDSIAETTRPLLGYTREMDELSNHASLTTRSEREGTEGIRWLAPTPQQLRNLLTNMSMPLFVQHVLPLAFQSMHLLHPEWGEGATFNAHLANYLRGIGTK
ncbi:MAG: hypothetical protein NVS4B12_26410 [Ktedonobacteraceae bacterium]